MDRLKRIFAPPTYEDKDETRQAYMLNFVTWVYLGLALFGTVSLLSLFSGEVDLNALWINTWYRVAPFLGGFIVGQILMRNGRVKAASVTFIIIIWVGYTVSMFQNGSVYSTAYAFYFLTILISGLLLGARATFLVLGSSILAGGVSAIFYAQGRLPTVDFTSTPLLITQWAVMIVGFSVATAVLYLFIRNRDQSEKEIQFANDELRQAQEALEIQISKKTRGLELAAEVGRDLAQERNLNKLIDQAVHTIQEQFDLYYVQIYLSDIGERRLMLRAGTGEAGNTLVQRGHHLAINPSSINGAAAYSKQPIVVSDTKSNPLFRPNALLPDTKAEMAIPLIVADHIVGVLNVQSDVVYGLTTDDFTTYNVLAGQVAIAIENANLFEETRKAQLAAEVSAKQSTRDAWEIYLDAIERHERFGYTFDGISLDSVRIMEEETTVSHRSEDELTVPIIINDELIGSIAVEADHLQDSAKIMVNAVAQQVAQQAESLRLLSETEKYRDEAEEAIRRLTRENWEKYEAELEAIGYEYAHDLVHPINEGKDDENGALVKELKIHGESIGHLEVLDVDSDSVEAEALIATVASGLSAHIENLRLTEQTENALANSQKRSEELDLINRIVSLATESLDMEYTLQGIVEELGREMNYDRVSIALINHAKNNFMISAEFNATENLNNTRGMTFSLDGMGIMADVVQKKVPIIVDDLQEQETNAPALMIMRDQGVQLFAVLPLMVGQDVVGMLSIASLEAGRNLGGGELALLETMIRQIATAVQNANLFANTQQRARRDQILNEITARVYSAVDAESILQTAAKEINRQLGLEAYVYLDDQVEIEPSNGSNGSN